MNTDPVLHCLFEPVKMPNLVLKNRLFMAPIGTGFEIERMIPYLAARAKGGVSMITTGETCVHPSGRIGLKNESVIEKDDDLKSLEKLAATVKKEGAKIILQLNHAGRYSPGLAVGGQSVAPSAVLSGFTGEMPRELSTDEADDLVLSFASAAKRAKEAGFDGVEFMGSSGYLISQFFSPLTNKRTDKYGGDAIGRAEFILSILRETRKSVEPDFNLSVKFDADDGMSGGTTIAESMLFAPELVKAGADRLNIWAGWHESSRPMLQMSVERGAFAYLSEEIKKAVNVPVAIAGRINDPYTAAKIITERKADMIGIARGLLADPEFVRKTMEGRIDEINKCTACCHCFESLFSGLKTGQEGKIRCMVNPVLNNEDYIAKKADKPETILIAGAGPAGLEAALAASDRGQRVVVYEKESRIGGMLNSAALPPFKSEIRNVIDYFKRQLELRGIEIKLNTALTADMISAEKPDAVIIATGSEIPADKIPVAENGNVYSAIDALNGKEIYGKSVIVIGGGMVGLETAEWLADNGRQVTVIEMDKIGTDIGSSNRWNFISRIRRKMKIMSGTTVTRITNRGVIVRDKDNAEKEILSDSVVLAAGLRSVRALADQLSGAGIECHVIGSAVKPGMIDEAIMDGYKTGSSI